MEMIKMIRKIAMFSALLSVCLLVTTFGCSKKTANSSNLQDALNHYFRGNPVCFSLGVEFPNTNFDNADFNQLIGVGLMSKTQIDGNSFRYDLTDAGRAVVSRERTSELCYGTLQVEKILIFTEPSNAVEGGGTESTVTFTTNLTNVPAWANSLAAESNVWATGYGLNLRKNLPEDKRKSKATLVLTNRGWRVEDIDGQPVTDDK